MTADRSVLVRLRADIADYQRKMAMAGATTAGFVKNLDSADTRMGNLVQTALALGPALVPIGGIAVPALAGLTSQLGFAVAGAGSAVMAFNGVGDALKALNDYQVEPTEETFAKLQETLRGLGPEAREFVVFLDEVTPKLQRLREEAQSEWLPGVESGIDDLLDNRLPELRGIIEQLSRGGGVLAAQTGAELASDDWEEFFTFLKSEAQPTLVTFGRTVGNIFEGLANTWMAMDPASDQFTAGLLDWSRNFADSTEDLDENEKFQKFLAYLQANGPEAVETLGALGGAVVDLVVAAAPVGSASLPILTALAETLSVIAESPAGPILIGAAAGMSAISRSVALFNAANGSAMVGLLTGTSKAAPGATAGLSGFNTAASRLQAATRVGIPALGVLALAFTDVEDRAGLSNTAMLGTMGLMAGPWGGLLGAGAGFVMDFAAANDDAADSLERVQAAIDTADYSQLRTQLDMFNADIAETEEKGSRLAALTKLIPVVGAWAAPKVDSHFGDQVADFEAEEAAAIRVRDAYESLAMAMGTPGFRVQIPLLGDRFIGDLDEVEAAIERARPALEALGVSAKDLAELDPAGMADLVERIRQWNRYSDSASGRTKILSEAILGLDDDLEDTATSAEMLSDALDTLLSPKLNVEDATTNWIMGLRELRKELAKDRTLIGDSTAALTNKTAIRDRVRDLEDMLVAEAEAGAGAAKITRILREQRRALLDAGEAAGLSREGLSAYLDELGLTPKLVRTLIEAKTEEAQARIRAVQAAMDRLRDKSITVTVNTRNGYFKDVPSGVAPGTSTPSASNPTPAGGGDQEYAGGGFTGWGSKHDIAGRVHHREFVFSEEATRGNEAMLDRFHRRLRADSGAPSYARAVGMVGGGAMRVEFAPAVVELRTPWGTQQVELKMRQVAKSEIEANEAFVEAIR